MAGPGATTAGAGLALTETRLPLGVYDAVLELNSFGMQMPGRGAAW